MMNDLAKVDTQIIQCPGCLGQSLQLEQNSLTCTSCKATYLIDGKIPVLLNEQHSQGLISFYKTKTNGPKWDDLDASLIAFPRIPVESPSPLLNKILFFLRYPYWRIAAPPSFPDLHQTYANNGRVLSLAGGATSPNLKGWLNMDILPYPSVDVIGDAMRLPFKDDTFSLITSNSALEHIDDPAAVLRECFRVLKPGGHLYMCVPQVCGRHHTVDYWRWTLPGLKLAMKHFEIVDEGARVGPGQFLPHLLEAIIDSSVPRPVLLREILRTLALWITFPIRFLDYLGRPSPLHRHYAHTVYAIGRKPMKSSESRRV